MSELKLASGGTLLVSGLPEHHVVLVIQDSELRSVVEIRDTDPIPVPAGIDVPAVPDLRAACCGGGVPGAEGSSAYTLPG